MDLRHLLPATALLLGAAGGAGATGRDSARDLAEDPAPRARHIVLFLVDDLGWQDASLPFHEERTPFNDRYRTPHLERLASEGMVLRHGYASAPVCTPTRTAIHTGQSPARSHITYWTLYADRDQTGPWKRGEGERLVAPDWRKQGLGPEDPTLARLLGQAGFWTIHVGKAHLGGIGSPGEDPRALGFQVNVAGHAPGGPGSFLGLHQFRANGRQGKPGASVWDVPGLEDYHDHDVYLTEALALEACREVREAARAGKRVFLSFAPYAVHAPIMANAKYLAHYPDLHPTEAAYATMVETVDHALGALLATLEAEGMLDETLFVYTSDNGGLSAHARGGERHTHNAPLRSGKGSAYEGGVRVPWVVRWPGVVEPGTVQDQPVISHDLYPTLLAAAGLQPPADHVVDGRDLAPLLADGETAQGETAQGEMTQERLLLWHMPHFWGVHGPGIQPYSAVRLGDLKLLFLQGDERLELYDVVRDPGEERDLAAERPQDLRRLAGVLAAELERRGAQPPLLRRGEAPAVPARGVLEVLAQQEEGR